LLQVVVVEEEEEEVGAFEAHCLQGSKAPLLIVPGEEADWRLRSWSQRLGLLPVSKTQTEASCRLQIVSASHDLWLANLPGDITPTGQHSPCLGRLVTAARRQAIGGHQS
jgi:hypothetical protein